MEGHLPHAGDGAGRVGIVTLLCCVTRTGYGPCRGFRSSVSSSGPFTSKKKKKKEADGLKRCQGEESK